MKVINENHKGFSTILAFALIPLSGFATDIYIPSLPSMARDLRVSTGAVQLSLVFFMVSSGISQLFVGSILDSFGRFKISVASLFVFAIASFMIGLLPNIYMMYVWRVVQGITVSLIVVGKRAYFVDIFSGEKLKHFTSMFSIIWATAPIIAPFIGGYLQSAFGWESNFYFLGGVAILFLILELIYGGESLKHFHPFKTNAILEVYRTMIKTADFALGVVILGTSYALLVVYGMASPFIIEHVFKFSPVITGYCSLLSGLSVLTGGIISKMLLKRPFAKKVSIVILLMVVLGSLMIFTATMHANIYSLVGFTMGIHICSGFVFNNVYGYCLGRFSKNAGTASGLTGGGMYITSSLFSYGLVSAYAIKNQALLGAANITFIIFIAVIFILFLRAKNAREQESLTKIVIAS